MKMKMPNKGVITAVKRGDIKTVIDPPVEIQKGDNIVVCAQCGQPYTDAEKANGLPKVCPRCGNGNPQTNTGEKPEAPFLWKRS